MELAVQAVRDIRVTAAQVPEMAEQQQPTFTLTRARQSMQVLVSGATQAATTGVGTAAEAHGEQAIAIAETAAVQHTLR